MTSMKKENPYNSVISNIEKKKNSNSFNNKVGRSDRQGYKSNDHSANKNRVIDHTMHIGQQ